MRRCCIPNKFYIFIISKFCHSFQLSFRVTCIAPRFSEENKNCIMLKHVNLFQSSSQTFFFYFNTNIHFFRVPFHAMSRNEKTEWLCWRELLIKSILTRILEYSLVLALWLIMLVNRDKVELMWNCYKRNCCFTFIGGEIFLLKLMCLIMV